MRRTFFREGSSVLWSEALALHFCSVLAASVVFGLAAGISNARAEQQLDTENLFTTHPIWRIEIELSSESADRLRAKSRQYVPATVRAFGQTIKEVGIHLKGATGSFRSLDDKPSFTLAPGKFIHGQKFLGLQKLHLNNSVEDPSYLREAVGSELFRAAQVPAPRVGHALVALNGRELGLYVLKEGFTKDFIGRYFSRTDGNLYDTDKGHDVDLEMKRHLGAGIDGEQPDLKRLASVATELDSHERWKKLQEVLDIKRFSSFMAMEVMTGHWDGYCLGRNNFRIYYDPASEKISFFPSGMDQILTKADLPWKPDMAGLVARSVMSTEEGRKLYSDQFRSYFNTLFHSEHLANRVSDLLNRLRPFLEPGQFQGIQENAADLCAHIVDRERSLKKQLSENEPALPDFNARTAALVSWKAFDIPEGGSMEEINGNENRALLHIAAGPKTSASWRTTVRLNPGHYRFRGKVKVNDATPLPFGNNHGANLRLAGRSERSLELTGSNGWKMLEVAFEVKEQQEVTLICEFRAASGEAWFEKDSLSLEQD